MSSEVKMTQSLTHLELPKASVKRIMKLSDEVSNIGVESVAAVAKVTELFLEKIITESNAVCTANNRKTIKIEDLLVVIQSNKVQLEFLNEAFSSQK